MEKKSTKKLSTLFKNKDATEENKQPHFRGDVTVDHDIPKGAKIINNYSGTAPGIFWSPKENFTILTFPGVPSELKEMWVKEAS